MDWQWLAVLVVLLVFGIAALRFRKSIRAESQPLALHDISLAQSFGLAISGTTFEEVLKARRSRDVIADRMLKEINLAVGQATADGLVVGLEIIQMSQARNLILAKFPEATAKVLKDGSAVQVVTKNGGKLLIAADKKGRRFASHAKQVDPTSAAKLSEAATLVVGVAHIIAGYDNAQKLKSIDGKLDRLLSRDNNQYIARLAEIFETLKDLFSEEVVDALGARITLRALRRDLCQLRNYWLREVNEDIHRIREPKKRFFLLRWFSRNVTTAKQLQNENMKQQEPLHYVRFALNMEQVIGEILQGSDPSNSMQSLKYVHCLQNSPVSSKNDKVGLGLTRRQAHKAN